MLRQAAARMRNARPGHPGGQHIQLIRIAHRNGIHAVADSQLTDLQPVVLYRIETGRA